MWRKWAHCHRWGWLAHDAALARGERVASGMYYAFFIGGQLDGKRASIGPMVC